jgi:hypothetical protein
MTERDWAGISLMLEKAFIHRPDTPWDRDRDAAYAAFLAHLPEPVVRAALRSVAVGAKWCPSAGEILAAVEAEPGVPTWPEIERWVRTPASRRPAAAHPLADHWIELQGGWHAVGMLPIDCPDQGRWERKRLMESWAQTVDAGLARDRHMSALAASGQPRTLDPIASLGLVTPGMASQIGSGEAA